MVTIPKGTRNLASVERTCLPFINSKYPRPRRSLEAVVGNGDEVCEGVGVGVGVAVAVGVREGVCCGLAGSIWDSATEGVLSGSSLLPSGDGGVGVGVGVGVGAGVTGGGGTGDGDGLGNWFGKDTEMIDSGGRRLCTCPGVNSSPGAFGPVAGVRVGL